MSRSTTFLKLRATMREYATTTTDDLRSRKLLEGNMDVYQWFLMISTHSQRHILQIREIKGIHPSSTHLIVAGGLIAGSRVGSRVAGSRVRRVTARGSRVSGSDGSDRGSRGPALAVAA